MSATAPHRALAACALALAVVAGAGCDPGAGVSSTLLVEVWVSSPHAADQALRIAFDDPVEAFEPTADIRHFQDATHSARALLVVADWPLAAGERLVGEASLRPRTRAVLPGARIIEAARSDYRMRESVDGYRVRLVPVDP
jgi:hypothetical protein